MLFTELAKAIHPYLMGDAGVPEYMRNLIQRLCDIPEKNWGTKKDPSSPERVSPDTLRQYYNRGLSKKLAKMMLPKLTKNQFIDSIEFDDEMETDNNLVMRKNLSQAVAPFTSTNVDENNVAEVLFNLFETAIESIIDPTLENQRKIDRATTISTAAKRNYGPSLLEDCKHTCSRPNCSNHLHTVSANHQTVDLYEVVKISGNQAEYENLLALCPTCFSSFSLKHTKKEESELRKIKKLQVQSASIKKTLRSVDIEYGIRKVIENLSRAKTIDMTPLSFNVLTVNQKIDKNTDPFLVNEVSNHVSLYFPFIEKSMQDEAKINAFDDDLLRQQIKSSYKKLAQKNYAPSVIYQSLVDRLEQITKQDARFCSIVISYFVQSCEVFDDITK